MPSFKRTAQFFLILLIITLVDFLYLGRPSIGIDDANIFMNYARHLSRGEGFVFNTGGEKVEGFTSLLWVLLCSLFYLITAHPEWLIMGFLLLLTTVTVSMVYEALRKEVELIEGNGGKPYFFWSYIVFLVCIGPYFITWSVLSLMETGLWNFLFLSIIIMVLEIFRNEKATASQKILLPTAIVLLLLTRPEGLAWGLFFTLLLVIAGRRNRTGYFLPLIFFLALAGTMVALTIFRKSYFGYPLPNTFYAKVSDDKIYNLKEGIKYLVSFVTDFHPLLSFMLVVLCMAVVASLRSIRLFEKNGAGLMDGLQLRMTIVLLIILLALVLPLTTGGDHFGGFRFYQDIFLLLAWGIPAVLWISKNRQAKKINGWSSLAMAAVISFLLMTAGNLYNLKNYPRTRLNFEFDIASEGREQAEVLNRFRIAPTPSVGVITVGGFALRYAGPTVDLMGLNNTVMGHSSGDRIGVKNHAAFNKDIFYQQVPDLLLPKLVADTTAAELRFAELLRTDNFDNQAMKNIFNDDQFYRFYLPVMMSKEGRNVFAFATTAMIKKLSSEPDMGLTMISLSPGGTFPKP